MARLLTAPVDEAGDAESRRKDLMSASDQLLDEVEILRLADETDVPASLQDAIHALQRRLSRNRPPVAPVTLHAAHDLVFAVQQRLMAANPKHPRPNRHQGRPTGQPLMTRVHPERLWKLLTLPAPPNGTADADWLELVESTVERAWDRWCYAQQHAVRAARMRTRPQVALAVARIAWTNYWELQQEATAIRFRLGARASSIRAGGLAALRR